MASASVMLTLDGDQTTYYRAIKRSKGRNKQHARMAQGQIALLIQDNSLVRIAVSMSPPRPFIISSLNDEHLINNIKNNAEYFSHSFHGSYLHGLQSAQIIKLPT